MANIIERTGSDVTFSEEVCEKIISLEKQAKEIKKQQDSMKKEILDSMQKYGVLKIDNEFLKIAFIPEHDTEKFNIKTFKEENPDVLICDTAGRLHNKKYLMDELNKIQKVINKEMPEASKEVLLVIDAGTGQNAISQVKAFKEQADITGIVLTKLDGTAKGGAVIGIVEENKIPVKFIGVGEQIDDMEIFNSEDFAKAII